MRCTLPSTGFAVWLVVPSLGLACAACGSDTSPPKEKPTTTTTGEYAVTIRQTSYGIPHILADDLPSAGAGLGFVAARDFGCILLDQIVRVRSERAKFFGPGDMNANLDSDFAMLSLGIRENAAKGLAMQSEALTGLIDGYVAGFNYYLAHDKLADECDGKPWARPLTAPDLFSYYYWLAQLGSADPLMGAIAGAAPPGAAQTGQSLSGQSLPDLAHSKLGSNGWAIGKDKSTAGTGMLLANPHFPWEGNRKFYENQITVPGLINVYGASLLGAPVVNIGFNENVAWTHTVTTADHFTLYSLNLAPGDPTSYLYDGKPRAMTSRDFTVDSLQADGTTTSVARTMYFSHYGPMLNIAPLGGWTDKAAYTFRNANADNYAIGEQWLRMNEAKSLDDLKKVNEQVQGIPWVNTMAVDAAGTALYMDASRTPNLSDAALSAFQTALANDAVTQAVDAQGAALLDGSDSTFEWQDAGAAAPGIVPFSSSPVQQRSDYVFNSNDSYWLTNPSDPLTGYSVMFGKERTPRTSRTRMNLRYLTEASPDGASGADGKFTFDELATVEFSDRASLSEILLTQVTDRCAGAGSVTTKDASIDVTNACKILGAWDGRFQKDSVGAVLFREFLASFDGATKDKGALFADAFDPDDPIGTPRVLVPAPTTGDDPVLVALAEAVENIQAAGFDVAAKLGDVQHVTKGTDSIGIQGGTNLEGAFDITDFNSDSGTLLESSQQGTVVSPPTGLSDKGYVVNEGSSFMLVMEFADAGPHAKALLSYSESSDPSSPYFEDQTELFSQAKYRAVAFTEADIAADPALKTTKLAIPKN